MYINTKENTPSKRSGANASMFVFIYAKNRKAFCIGYYDYQSGLWFQNDGMVITYDFIWTYLPIKQMKTYLNMLEHGTPDDI